MRKKPEVAEGNQAAPAAKAKQPRPGSKAGGTQGVKGKAAADKKSPAKAGTKSKAAVKKPTAQKAAKETAAKKSSSATTKKSTAQPKAAAKKPAPRPRKAAKESREAKTAEISALALGVIEDPIGDVSDGEGHRWLVPEDEAAKAVIAQQSAQQPETKSGEEEEPLAAQRPEAKLERLQKILSHAGVASRRHAEEMMVAGRVMVNGQVITQLGAKADPERDHIRVDGKLLQGAVRHRTFVLNKPKGYVTTVSDPEGRPTVMQFFDKTRERLYPVGRLDYQSEGLLLMTNDGELANLLTRAASGVEKTYLVKVAGQLSADDLERLRSGVAIERGGQGSERVRTALASLRQIRPGDNPWYEVVLIEGRNREIRKMFAAVGHYAEKIRRVGYGPLALDVEPGKVRELTPEEVNALRLTVEGKMKPRRPKTWAMLPKDAGKPAEARAEFRPERRGPAQARHEGRGGRGEGRFRQQGERGGAARPGFQERRSAGGQGGERLGGRAERFGNRGGKRGGRPQGFGGRGGPRREFGGERRGFERKPGFDRSGGFDRPRGGRGEFSGEEQPRRQFGPRSDRPEFTGSEERERRFGRESGRGFAQDREQRWGRQQSGERRGDEREQRAPGFRAQGRPGGEKRSPQGGGGKPGGFRKPGFKSRPGGDRRRGRG